MLRLRTFHGYSKCRGKWSDTDGSWTKRLRQMPNCSADANDGTFWRMSVDVTLPIPIRAPNPTLTFLNVYHSEATPLAPRELIFRDALPILHIWQDLSIWFNLLFTCRLAADH